MNLTQLLLTLCVVMQQSGAKPLLATKDVVDRWDAGSRLIESYDLSIDFQSESFCISEGGKVRLVRPGESNPPRHFYSHIFRSGDKRYGEFGIVENDLRERQLLFDGTALTAGSPEKNEYIIQGYCNLFGATQLEDYEALYRMALGTTDRIALARQRATRLMPREGRLYVIDIPPADKPIPWGEIGWKIWLDPDRNFMPTKLAERIVKSGRSLAMSDCAVDLAEVTPGVWAPVAAKYTLYGKNPELSYFGQVVEVDRLQVVTEESRFNIAIPDDRFTIKIPDGATVTDRIRNIVYTQGASDPDAYLSNLAKQGKDAVVLPPSERITGDLVTVPDRPRFWTSGRLIAAVAAGIAALAAVAWWRPGRRTA